jgi:hypothetical protein
MIASLCVHARVCVNVCACAHTRICVCAYLKSKSTYQNQKLCHALHYNFLLATCERNVCFQQFILDLDYNCRRVIPSPRTMPPKVPRRPGAQTDTTLIVAAPGGLEPDTAYYVPGAGVYLSAPGDSDPTPPHTAVLQVNRVLFV